MKVRAVLRGGPHDGAECELDGPAPTKLMVLLNDLLAEYHYLGTENWVAIYGVKPPHWLTGQTTASTTAA